MIGWDCSFVLFIVSSSKSARIALRSSEEGKSSYSVHSQEAWSSLQISSFPEFSPVDWEFSCVKRSEFELLLLDPAGVFFLGWNLITVIKNRKKETYLTKLCGNQNKLMYWHWIFIDTQVPIIKIDFDICVTMKFKVVSCEALFFRLNTGIISFAKVPESQQI